MQYKIQQAAKLLGVSVRTLHYYDHIGLAGPAGISPTGYRFYDEAALERLRRVLFYRDLGFSLGQIGPLLEAETAHNGALPPQLAQMLAQHRQVLVLQRRHLEELLARLDAMTGGINTMDMTHDTTRGELEEARRTAAEARRRWGDTEAWAQSEKKAAERTLQQDKEMQQEANEIFAAFAALRGTDAADASVQTLVQRWQAHISRYYYTCTPQILACLGQMYTADERFTQNLDAFGEGTARLMAEAIAVYCAQA